MDTMINGWMAGVWSDVFAGQPHWEDGSVRDELCFYVVCENERGERYGSRISWTTEEMHRSECEAKAEAHLARVVEALRKGADPKASAKWFRTRSSYGSAAWSEAEELEAEGRDLEAEGSWEDGARMRARAQMMGA